MDTDVIAGLAGLRRVHVGRQLIVDAARSTIGYELLFRGHSTATTSGAESGVDPGDAATTAVILATFTSFGLRQLVGEGLAFVNLTRPFFVCEEAVPFAPEGTVLEVLETFPVDDEVAAGVRRLRAAGFAVALDDFLWEQTDRIGLLDDVTHVKVDISQVPPSALADTVARLRRHDLILVAERIETAADLRRCTDLGFELFQGYHLLRPETVSTTALSPSAVSALEVLSLLAEPDLAIEALEQVVYRDAALTVRVLQAANAAASGARRRFSSVREALVMLGTQRLKAWVMLMVAADAGGPDAGRLTDAVIRARCCELLAADRGVRPDVAFTAGLVSRLDVVLGIPFDVVLERLGLAGELREALVDRTGSLGALLRDVEDYLDCFASPSCGDEPSRRLADAHVQAIAWATGALANG